MTLEELRGSKRDRILRLADSDIDFLVDLDPERTLMDLGGLLKMLRPKVLIQALRDAVPS